MKGMALLIMLPLWVSQVMAESGCVFTAWDQFQGTALLHHSEQNAYLFTANEVRVDADGAPNAYHPDDVSLHCTQGEGFKGLDCPANGGYPKHSWWRSAIVADPDNPAQAYVQPEGTFKGFLVSRTSLQDEQKAVTDPQRYVDSRSVPYLVFPGDFYKKKGTGILGDFGYALNLSNGKSSPFIIADIGPARATLGDMSIALASALGGDNPNPRTGAGTPSGTVVYMIFPRSKKTPDWPLSLQTMNDTVNTLLNSAGGDVMLKTCTGSLQ
ncbi:glycoside hydrolase family 75 protein [Thalassolituus pacificus]|uniref:Glycoside hydrolase family 75 protein n=1 Tax=Thalassolituus pacificus TaxID=2975440 RepID=A0A9X2WI75_9GAMM|nr:glycoside hydrolase family 75 protein [Thalassolituus pacificus]MCT7360641.1 glycoside hydrolase family 75 protein [Thalassolituus pacificus]